MGAVYIYSAFICLCVFCILIIILVIFTVRISDRRERPPPIKSLPPPGLPLAARGRTSGTGEEGEDTNMDRLRHLLVSSRWSSVSVQV